MLLEADRSLDARVDVVSPAGRLLRVLAEGPVEAGAREVAWDGRDAEGRPAPAGVYIVRAQASGRTVSTAKITLVR